MPLKVQYPLPLVGLEPYQLGVQIRAKKNKIMLSYFDKKVLFLKDENEKMVKTTRKIFTNGVNLSEIWSLSFQLHPKCPFVCSHACLPEWELGKINLRKKIRLLNLLTDFKTIFYVMHLDCHTFTITGMLPVNFQNIYFIFKITHRRVI